MNIKKLYPLINGKKEKVYTQQEQEQMELQGVLQEDEVDSDEQEHLNKSYFESMVYWQFE